MGRTEEHAEDPLTRWTDHLEKLVASDLAADGVEKFLAWSFRALQFGSCFVATETALLIFQVVFNLVDTYNWVKIDYVLRLDLHEPKSAE